MILTEGQKKEQLNRLWDITVASYSPAQTPSREKFERVVNEGQVFVTALCRNIVKDIIGYALVTETDVPVLRSIAVDRLWSGRGYGRALLEELTNFYRQKGCQRIILHVKYDNPAQKLYFDAGYRVMNVLKDYYAPEGDGLEMEKVL